MANFKKSFFETISEPNCGDIENFDTGKLLQALHSIDPKLIDFKPIDFKPIETKSEAKSAARATHYGYPIHIRQAWEEIDRAIVAKQLASSRTIKQPEIAKVEAKLPEIAKVEAKLPEIYQFDPSTRPLSIPERIANQQQTLVQMAAKIDALTALCTAQADAMRAMETRLTEKDSHLQAQIETFHTFIPCIRGNAVRVTGISRTVDETTARVDHLMNAFDVIIPRVNEVVIQTNHNTIDITKTIDMLRKVAAVTL
ncbi:MAG: hypothetical protein Faunusvirus33_9 [Faunusvirus sp.]|jgi:hypothetical protein|uniref:Uncharacterized protein n=1 Tax=Faunusvirus sp. TaxID=2487766 RepID=A0A3G4ZXM0_9VIRU|nr:MAG: hypothetical protein Faunusvirus33_9 [Faunusvirus sp.]